MTGHKGRLGLSQTVAMVESVVRQTSRHVIYLGTRKSRMLDRWLDKVVALSGSNVVIVFTIIALLTWALLGIKFANRTGWRVGISDAQAIINMVFDSFLFVNN